MLRKMTLSQVRAYARQHGECTITVVPCKMMPRTNWYYGIDVTVEYNSEVSGELTVKGSTVVGPAPDYADIPLTFETWLINFNYYNASYETGYYAAYYRIK